MELTDIKSLNEKPTDPRLRNESFRQDVRLVLKLLRVENTLANFKKYDKKYGSDYPVDWEETADRIRHPRQQAIVAVLYRGNPTGKGILIDLPGRTKTEALKSLDTEQYKFKEWW